MQIFFDSLGLFAQYGGRKGGCRTVAGSVFVNIKGRIKMGDARPLAGQFFVYGQRCTVIAFVAVQPAGFKFFGLQRTSLIDLVVNEFFKFGKLHLTVNRVRTASKN